MKKDLVYRRKYLEKVRPFIGKSLIKVFTGQRRVGKSYLLFQIMQEIQVEDKNAHLIYINKEDLAFSHITNAETLNSFVQEQKKCGQKNYIFIDEIQEITDFDQALRSLLLDDELDLYCTGSNAHLLSRDIAGALSGRAIEINVHPLSYFEFFRIYAVRRQRQSHVAVFKIWRIALFERLAAGKTISCLNTCGTFIPLSQFEIL
ncbi:ATPase [Actinobacillus pleuropneumoniae]|nr:ATPase [Actinobacillus pleuropneumoniae]